ncbi:hypothetical protein GQR58_011332 [Nymphon striatum]|nr:hypothetical protein GQR58_011332 [Nymphon striatum]
MQSLDTVDSSDSSTLDSNEPACASYKHVETCISERKLMTLKPLWNMIPIQMMMTEAVQIVNHRYETARSLRMIEISENVKGVKYDACSRFTGDGGAQVLDLSQKVVENSTKNCYECQILGRPEPPVPLVSTKVPENAWEYLTTDLMGPLPNGEHVLVLVDYYSRYFELPTVERHGRLEGCESWKEKDTLNKFKMKEYSDERKGTKFHDVKVGNRVLVKVNKQQNKLTPEFERKPYEVTRVKGGKVECMNESRKIRRNESQLKKLNERIIESLNEDVQAGDDKSEQLEESSRARESVNNNLEEKELESNVSLTNRSRASESINNSLAEKDNLEPKASLRKSTRVSKFPSNFKDFVT